MTTMIQLRPKLITAFTWQGFAVASHSKPAGSDYRMPNKAEITTASCVGDRYS